MWNHRYIRVSPSIDWDLAWQHCPFRPDVHKLVSAKPVTRHFPNAIEKPFGYGRVLAFLISTVNQHYLSMWRDFSREIMVLRWVGAILDKVVWPEKNHILWRKLTALQSQRIVMHNTRIWKNSMKHIASMQCLVILNTTRVKIIYINPPNFKQDLCQNNLRNNHFTETQIDMNTNLILAQIQSHSLVTVNLTNLHASFRHHYFRFYLGPDTVFACVCICPCVRVPITSSFSIYSSAMQFTKLEIGFIQRNPGM